MTVAIKILSASKFNEILLNIIFTISKYFICKRLIKFNVSSKLNIVDAIWHKGQEDCIICLTSDYYLRYFKLKNPKIQYKEYHLLNTLSNSNLDQITSDQSSSKGFFYTLYCF